jgi:hypothetical protein
MARRKRKRWESAELNNRTYQHYFNRLMELSISMFEWQNLPDTVDARFLEYTLFTDGMAVFFNDEVIGHLCLQTMIGGKLDVYRIPTIRTAYASNGYNRKLSEKDSVIIFNNMIHTNCINDIELYARRLYECDRTMDVNIKAQKTPVMIACDENQRLTMINLYQQYDGNEPFIFGNKDIDIKKIQSITTNAPFVSDKIMDLKNQIWNEALTYLGISNVSYQKKERLISAEVSRSMGGTVASRYTRLDMRQQACEKINKMFGLDIWVEYREDTKMVTDDNLVQEEGGEIE